MSLLSHLEASVTGDVRSAVPLAPWTSVRVGGAADIWVKPSTPQALETTLRLAQSEQAPVTVLGGGANTLVADGGVAGLTVKLPPDLFPEHLEKKGDELLLTFGAGAPIARLIVQMKAHRMVGAEFLAGIPGTLGGAITMNAGTKHGECMSVVDAVEVATPDGTAWLLKSSLTFGYRFTQLPPGAVVTRVRFRLHEGDTEASAKAMETDLAYRKRTQPLSQPNFGSVFTNPPGTFAGKLIEGVGLKGFTEGKAQISPLHANWIVNLGGATAKDVVALISLAQSRVFDSTGIRLTPEVKRVGRF